MKILAGMEPQLLPFTNVKLSTIRPLQKVDHVDTIDPTFLDLQYQDICFPLLFAFRLGDKSEALYSQQVNNMKESLQQVLVSFFSYAGRWIPDPVESSKRKLLCNDAGVPIVEAYLDRDLDSVVDASAAFQPVPELQGFGFVGLDVTQFKQQMPPGGLPCMFVQITRFKCGGVTCAVTFNHTLTDGTGFLKFIEAWVLTVIHINLTKTVDVDHGRPAQIEVASMETVFSKPPSTNTASSNGVDGAAPPLETRRWGMKAFEVNRSTIESIKQKAKDRPEGGSNVSTVACIAAHLWKSLAAVPSSLLGGRDVSVVTTVEGRARFYPTPQPNLSGNVLSLMPAPKIPNSELLEMPLASIASQLRETLQTTKRGEWLNSEKLETFTRDKSAAMQIISWLRFPIYELDFGWGKPVLCSLNNFMYYHDRLGKVYITQPIPNSCSSSVATVQIFSSPELLEALEGSPSFQSLFVGQTINSRL